MNKTTVGVIGLGFVGNAIFESFKIKIKELELTESILLYSYDKYKNGGIGNFDECLKCEILFLALPTLYNDILKSYEYDSIYETCELLEKNNFSGIIVIKSTVEPSATEMFSKKFNKLHFIHNPEFLTARTAFHDFHNQSHIVIGKGPNCPDNKINLVVELYSKLYPQAKINICKSVESESMKIFCNSFYAVKIQYFNELYLLCEKLGSDYQKVVELMLQNNWINPMHTQVPGPDGKLSYGGMCFPKDTNALLQFMKKNNSPHQILEATITERNEFREKPSN
ncbi:putative UDP-glucose 6-dehydrogenase [Catovirus CTV1]|uniref:Putative UDP-glucose 6-dehydrogenase n=1 Tax=Catovirus CTV1 TaxID=1977631 RepID=A0A1V0SAG2_9VIRU|nr:putative UDP-glucose 6-dehydrogenase [Catovirus CTV1]